MIAWDYDNSFMREDHGARMSIVLVMSLESMSMPMLGMGRPEPMVITAVVVSRYCDCGASP